MDTSTEKAVNVILKYGTVFKFKECQSGLNYYDMASTYQQNSAKNNASITSYSLLSNVTDIKEFYARADIEGADISIIYQGLLGSPGKISFKTYVNNNILLNFNITVDEINISDHIYGEATPILQGKITRKKPTVH